MNDLGLLDALKNHIGIYNLDLPQHLRDEIEEFMEKTKTLKLKKKPEKILIDGAFSIKEFKNSQAIIKGDQKIPEISAASIVAKVARDRLITKMSKKFKKYSWDKNAGYGTKEHLKAIKKFGITKHHRKTFKPIHNILSPN